MTEEVEKRLEELEEREARQKQKRRERYLKHKDRILAYNAQYRKKQQEKKRRERCLSMLGLLTSQELARELAGREDVTAVRTKTGILLDLDMEGV